LRVVLLQLLSGALWQDELLHACAAAQGKPGFFMFGEVYDGSDRLCGSYTGTKAGGPFALDSVLD
jgi:hypothetical protein